METIGFTGIREVAEMDMTVYKEHKWAVYLDDELMVICDTLSEAYDAIENETTDYKVEIL